MRINNKEIESILVTGGTGSFGKEFIKKCLESLPSLKRLVVYSRDELKQWELSQIYPLEKFPCMRYFLGDVRDKDRFEIALEGIQCVVHAAALKQVPAAEYNPSEFIKTNINGAENIIKACLSSNVKKVVALSTDKAAAPINLYGATKLCSDKLFLASNNIKGSKDISFSVVRYGNVLGSRGSVVPHFLKLASSGVLPVTHPKMTRFSLTLKESVDMVLWTINHTSGGEIIIPKIPSYRILELAEAIAPNCKKEIIGLRPGEKIEEELITINDSPNTYELDNYFAIIQDIGNYPNDNHLFDLIKNKVKENFVYKSSNNDSFLTVEEIRKLIIDNVDRSFDPGLN